MRELNVVNPSKKGKITGRVFNLFIIDSMSRFLIDGNDFNNPIVWCTTNKCPDIIQKLDELIVNGNENTIITIYTYKWTATGWKLFTGQGWTGKISETRKRIW